MSSKRTKQDTFQIELNEAVKNRRKLEEINPRLMDDTDTDDDTDYSDDDFDDDNDSLLNDTDYTRSIIPSKTVKSDQNKKFDWNLPSYLDEDASDILAGGSSRFLKREIETKSYQKPSTHEFNVGQFGVKYSESSVVKDHDLQPEDFESSRKAPTPARRGIDKKQTSKDEIIPRHQRAVSPFHAERSSSPSSGSTTTFKRKTPERVGHRSPVHSPDYSLDSKEHGELFGIKQKGFEKRHKVTTETRTIPVGSGKSSPIQGILDTMKSSITEDNNLSLMDKPSTKSKHKSADKSQSYTDFLLEQEKPRAVPRKKGSKSPDAEPLKLPRKSLSPTFSKNKESKDVLKTEKSSDSLKQRRSQSPDRKRTESPIQHLLLPRNETASFPSLPVSTTSLTASGIGTTSTSQDAKSDRAKSKAEADDILALFSEATRGEPVNIDAHIQQKQSDKATTGRKTPVNEVIQRTSDQQIHGDVKQRLSRQVMDNAIDVVAEHNAIPDVSSISSKDAEEIKKKNTKHKKGKSYRTPPANYQGLGSLTMLKELKKGKNSQEEEDIHANTEDIRKMVYLEWLASREAETKKRRKAEAQKKKEIEEKELKENQDRKTETELVRRKWEEVKKEKQKEKDKKKRKEEKVEREKRENEEKEKIKKQKEVEKKRSLLLEYAKREHKAESKIKQQKEKERKKKEAEQKEKNEKAVEDWKNKRGDKWLSIRKQEQKNKQKQENEEKKKKEKEAKEAENKYNRWREHKDNELKASLRESKAQERQRMIDIEDEENYQPPWSPPSKVIPRRR